jgi:4-hydroxy-4-methyl-2-oxoglutarate aldolase
MNSWVYKYACTGMFSDQLDKMGFPHQVIAGLRPNNPHLKFYGQIRTARFEMIKTKEEDLNLNKELRFLGCLSPGEILCVEASSQFAYFGELMSRISIRQKLGGVIIGGLTRDSYFTQNLDELLIFSEGYSPCDLKGRGQVQDTDVQIKIKGVPVNSGDWAFGDSDGIVIIPEQLRLDLGQRIIKSIKAETDLAKEIDSGMSIEELLKKHKEF